MSRDEMFPIQSQRGAKAHRLRIPWSVAEKAYAVYQAEYGSSQSLERLAQRGGFGPGEMDMFHPAWREESDEIFALKAEIANLKAAVLSVSPSPSEPALSRLRQLRRDMGSVRTVLARKQFHEPDDEAQDRMLTRWESQIDQIESALIPATFHCKAKHAAIDPPQDCNWPCCGCDPHADKVIEALQEAGQLGASTLSASPSEPRPARSPSLARPNTPDGLRVAACAEGWRIESTALFASMHDAAVALVARRKAIATPEPGDEEMVPHKFMPMSSGDGHGEAGSADEEIWCADCEYHRDHQIHVAALPEPEAAPPHPSEDVSAFLDRMLAEARNIPVGHEIPSRGCSTFNWTVSIIHQFRAALAASSSQRPDSKHTKGDAE